VYPYQLPLNHLYTIFILACMDVDIVGGGPCLWIVSEINPMDGGCR
jgi:hypothetical protein